jgi:exodeoxyribonuclease-1
MDMTFYFYDLETSGFSPQNDRIMQFAGQRTDMDLKPLGKADNILVKVTPDVLPQPDAVLVHSITPQKTISEGISEAEFCKYLTSQVFTSGTIAVGYNNVRFDNNFIRFCFWRNFTDAYEWAWKDGCSTWDLLDLTRMTRAIRPDGIKWPFASDGKPSNKLEFLSAVNKLDHVDAHDALSDVKATIALAQLIKSNQPQLFDFLLKHRDKKLLAPLITSGRPVVYTSGRYPSEFNKTTAVVAAAHKNDRSGALVYDLRIDPDEFIRLSAAELSKRWAARGEDVPYFPVKSLSYNKCPAVAPIEVLEKDNGYERLQLRKELVKNHLEKLKKADGFGTKLLEALELMWPKAPTQLIVSPQEVDKLLYDGFIPDEDKTKMSAVRAAEPADIDSFTFKDKRLQELLPLYKARNYPRQLTDSQRQAWDKFCYTKLVGSSQIENYFKRLEELAKTPGLDGEKQYLLEELNLYAQSILPAGVV